MCLTVIETIVRKLCSNKEYKNYANICYTSLKKKIQPIIVSK